MVVVMAAGLWRRRLLPALELREDGLLLVLLLRNVLHQRHDGRHRVHRARVEGRVNRGGRNAAAAAAACRLRRPPGAR